MTPELAANILAKAKRLAPDRVGQPSPEAAAAWAEALAEFSAPPRLWSEAVTLWATTRVGDRMATPRDLIAAARAVRDRWESHPEGRELLAQSRLERLNANYARMGLEAIDADCLPDVSIQPQKSASGQSRRQNDAPARLASIPNPLQRRN